MGDLAGIWRRRRICEGQGWRVRPVEGYESTPGFGWLRGFYGSASCVPILVVILLVFLWRFKRLRGFCGSSGPWDMGPWHGRYGRFC